MISNKINWGLLQEAINYYKIWGYTHIDVPWYVPTQIRNITFSGECFDEIKSGYSLVGSAEQSFIYLDSIGKLETGKYVACSPCFRRLDDDETHNPQFVKVELYVNYPHVTNHDVKTMLKQAKEFFNSRLLTDSVDVVKTDKGYDIELNGIEIGSYGICEYNNKKWVYGTAIAEPRFSYAYSQKKVEILSKREDSLNIKGG